jgi:hypothetical protein
MSRYADQLDSTLQGASVPYGYTLTVWCSGQFLSDLRGQPKLVLVPLFAAGAALAYGLLRWLAGRAGPTQGDGGSPHPLRALLAQVASMGAAIGAVAAVGQIPSGLDWALGGFVATAVYLSGTALGGRPRRGG